MEKPQEGNDNILTRSEDEYLLAGLSAIRYWQLYIDVAITLSCNMVWMGSSIYWNLEGD